jgi:hypothetical protein
MPAPNRVVPSDNDVRRERSPREIPAQRTLHWRIYYTDGYYVSSKDCAWEHAPSEHIVAVVHALNDDPAECQLGTPYYWNHGDWIARTWDVSLYLRQTGRVKFGRWASHGLFNDAWRMAVRSLSPHLTEAESCTPKTMQGGMVFISEPIPPGDTSDPMWELYYDDNTRANNTVMPWLEAPTDGVLCATYSIAVGGARMRCATRRYTYYFWKGHELINTDDLDVVLKEFPQCKKGQPSFTGASYRHQGEAIAQALKDDLEDLR